MNIALEKIKIARRADSNCILPVVDIMAIPVMATIASDIPKLRAIRSIKSIPLSVFLKPADACLSPVRQVR